MKFSLWDLIRYFLKLGTTGFGGPVALIGYMHRDLVEKRGWFSEETYKQGLTLSQLAPGPLAAQLAIYLGFVSFGIPGATLVGIAFVLPSFLMVLAIGFAYKAFGGLPWMQSLFYGVGAAVVGIILISSYKLTIKSIGNFNLKSFKEKWILWLFFIVCALITLLTRTENVFLFVAFGLIYMWIKNPPKRPAKLMAFVVPAAFGAVSLTQLEEIAVFFAKAGTFVFGSGLAIVPFLHSGVVVEHQWLTEQQFLDAVAVAMITPGPVVITVGFIGFLVAGVPGAIVAALATFLPCYLFTIIPAPYFAKHGANSHVKSFVEGITAAVVGALFGAVFVIAQGSIVDPVTAIIAIAALIVLFKSKKIQEPQIVLAAGLIGLMIRAVIPG